jgi:hypothetical protein
MKTRANITAIDALGSISGLDRKSMDSILTDVRANLAKLDACTRHEFVGVPECSVKCKDGVLYRNFRCVNCGGTVDFHTEHWYRLGIEHGRANP